MTDEPNRQQIGDADNNEEPQERKKLGRKPIFAERMIPDSYQIPAQTLGRLRKVARGMKTSKSDLLRRAIDKILEERKEFWQEH